MTNTAQNIPCPECQTNIPFDTKQLLMGVKFVCPNCHASIGLAAESKSMVGKTMEQFEDLKSKLPKGK
jgi:transcription initiation factor IIE alpha subunit